MELFWYSIKDMDSAAYEAAVRQMPRDKQQRMKDIANEDDRKRTAAADALARKVLGQRLGLAPEAVPITCEDTGKPDAAGCDLYFSVSHSGAWVVCAVDDRPVGVDVEVIRGADEKFMRRVCSEAELAYIRFGDAGCYERFWECWTAKEALFKLTGKGPLLCLSRLQLPADVALDHILVNGCSVTAAVHLM